MRMTEDEKEGEEVDEEEKVEMKQGIPEVENRGEFRGGWK